MGAQRPGQAEEGDDAEGGLQRPAEEGAGAPVPDTEVHQQAGQEEARREAGTQGQPGEDAGEGGSPRGPSSAGRQ